MKLYTNISVENIITIATIVCSVILAFGFMQYDIDIMRKELEKVFRKAGINNKETWDKILADGGSVQDIKELDKWCYVKAKLILCSDASETDDPIPVKEVYKTFKETWSLLKVQR